MAPSVATTSTNTIKGYSGSISTRIISGKFLSGSIFKPIEEAKQQLPAYDRAVQYPALTEAQRLAREKGGVLPELSEAEKVKIKGEPTQVLGGYRKEVTRLEKAIRKAQA